MITLNIINNSIKADTLLVGILKTGDHQTLGGFPKVKEGSSRGFDGK